MRLVSGFTLAVLLVAIAGLALACGDGETGRVGSGQGLTDPRTAPTSTPWATPPPVVYVEEGMGPVGPGNGTYTVQANDTLYDIAQRFGVTVEELMEANDITDPASLSIGQKLVIPGQEPGRVPQGTATPEPGVATATPSAEGVYIVQEGDYPSSIAERFGISVEALMEANGITDPTSLRVGQELIIPTATPSP
ncbi:MAG: LysM peptidoglycan-binding domain-containing protein [Dehalococcoidia bacterium]